MESYRFAHCASVYTMQPDDPQAAVLNTSGLILARTDSAT